MNSTYQYTEDDIKAYVIGAIRQEEITYCKKNSDIEVSSELSESILKGFKESSNEIPNPGTKGSASKKKKRYKQLKAQVHKLSMDPNIRAEAGKKDENKNNARCFSESGLGERVSVSKVVRQFSPPK